MADYKSFDASNGFHDARAYTIFGDSRKGAKQWQEDSFFTFRSSRSLAVVAGVYDGHGGYNGLIASNTAKEVSEATLEKVKDECETWSREKWGAFFTHLFETIHVTIRERFMHDQSTEDLNRSNAKRYLDDKGIVRSTNGDPIHGGTTGTVAVLLNAGSPDASIVCANVGDSTALLVTQQSKFEFLTVDHGPENVQEYFRVQRLPADAHPEKLLYVYDKATVFRKYECPKVFLDDGTKDPLFVQNPWGNGLHPTNVRYEPAVYAVTPRQVSKDTTCIAMTRALGDFYAHQFGLSFVPSITYQKAPTDVQFTICVASDGIWDCWKYEEFTEYINTKAKAEPVENVVEHALTESISKAIANFGSKHYDDACLVCVKSPHPR